jgi:hypothetical protein
MRAGGCGLKQGLGGQIATVFLQGQIHEPVQHVQSIVTEKRENMTGSLGGRGLGLAVD